jgi:hypothetical protein
MASVFRSFLDKLGGSDAATFVGTAGELFWDPTTDTLRISDGSTPGGTVVSGASAVNVSGLADVVYSNIQQGDGFVYNAVDGRWENQAQPVSTFTYAQYKFKSHDSGNPNAGEIRLSHATPGDVTSVHISYLTDNGVDLSNIIRDSMVRAVGFYIQDKSDASNYVLLQTIDGVNDLTTHHQLPCKYVAHGGTITNNTKVMVGTYLMGETFKVYPSPAPTTSTSPGLAGEIRYDSDYIYLCVSDNNWKRSSLGGW